MIFNYILYDLSKTNILDPQLVEDFRFEHGGA